MVGPASWSIRELEFGDFGVGVGAMKTINGNG